MRIFIQINNGETNEEFFNLKCLLNFVRRELLLSEDVKNILNSNCEEAKFALKSWPQEIVHKEVNQSLCNCYGVRYLFLRDA